MACECVVLFDQTRPTQVPTRAPTLPPHYGYGAIKSLNAEDEGGTFAISSKTPVTEFSIHVVNVTSISIRFVS